MIYTRCDTFGEPKSQNRHKIGTQKYRLRLFFLHYIRLKFALDEARQSEITLSSLHYHCILFPSCFILHLTSIPYDLINKS